MRFIKSELRFLAHVWRLNLASAMEYRVNFLTQAIMMIINNAFYFVFWVLFFERFNQIKGWAFQDILLLFSVVTVGFGLAFTFFGNGNRLSHLIEEGQLDYYLVLPRDVMLYSLASRTSVAAIGDIIFGVLMFFISGNVSLQSFILWISCSFLVAGIMVAYVSIVGSIAFWTKRAKVLSEQAINAVLTFSLYPNQIFVGSVRFILFTIVPAGFISSIPVEIIRDLKSWNLLLLAAYTIFIIILSRVIFNRGLRRYESGNLFNVNM
ncbi:MAG: ABC-2 family transporter protein [Halanaerobiales bacterium]|nr:ABC-2 family transporter protein [Halanaerobiales bacterium]